MRRLRQLIIRLANVFIRRRSGNRFNAEIEEHIALQTQDNVHAGMSLAEARRQAFLKFGAMEPIKESYRYQEGLPILETTLRDMKYALRVLRKSPGFTAITVITPALGIGLNSAIFSAVYAILLNPLPYPHADRLVMTWERVNLPSYKSERNDPTPGDFSDWKRENTVFQDMAGLFKTQGIAT